MKTQLIQVTVFATLSVAMIGPGFSQDIEFVNDGVGCKRTQMKMVKNGRAPRDKFRLNLLHFSDQEASASAVVDAPRFSAVLNALRKEYVGADGVLTLSSGDAFIPGLFFETSKTVLGSPGMASMQIQNELGVQAIALGNHEFDRGTNVLAGLISGDAAGDFSILTHSSLAGKKYHGACFPYLSVNLDFSTDQHLTNLMVQGGLPAAAKKVTSSVVFNTGGELFGVVGATTPTLGSISSPGGLAVVPIWRAGDPSHEELDGLAALIQKEVDALLADYPLMNKVILLSHMQTISVEIELAKRLRGVDIVVAGGSNTRLFDSNDRPRDGDSMQGTYPQMIKNAGGSMTALVNTDGSYKYVGRLVIDFDDRGNIMTDSYDSEVSGAFPTDAQGVADLAAETLVDPEIKAIADALGTKILETESKIFGVSGVYLNGNTSGAGLADDLDGVRTQQTNLGDLTADANYDYANRIVGDRDGDGFGDIWLSIKNGGSIRSSIGQIFVPPGGFKAIRTSNESITVSVRNRGNIEIKPKGGISQSDIQAALAFNNDLVFGLLSAADIVKILEHGVSGAPESEGRFPQISGVVFSFNPNAKAGSRIRNAAFVDPITGDFRVAFVIDGKIVSKQKYGVVALGFMVDGGDDYPFDKKDFINGNLKVVGDYSGAASFAETGTEQDALAEFLWRNHNPENGGLPFKAIDQGADQDTRILPIMSQRGKRLNAAIKVQAPHL